MKYFKPIGHKQKDLINTPYYMAEALREDGWYLRSDIAWCKAAPMPESVRDRPTSAWEHIWMLTKRSTYYYDADAVREPHAEKSFTVHTTPRKGDGTESTGEKFNKWLEDTGKGRVLNPAGANQRNWWLLGPDPYPGQHWATFPRELVRRCVSAGSSEYGACTACGAPYMRTTETKQDPRPERDGSSTKASTLAMAPHPSGRVLGENGWNLPSTIRETTGWAASCKCGAAAGVRPCVVLDPFSGSGTTAYVAASLGRVGIGVELSEEYTRQARYGRLAQDFLPFGAPASEVPA